MDMDVHAEVLKAGKDVTGCTVHFVTDVIDGGPIVCRRHVQVDSASSSPYMLKAKVQVAEGEALLSALRAFQDGTTMSMAAASTASDESKHQVTYADAGVSIEEGNALIEDIKPHCKATRRTGCDASLGGFGGCFDMRAAGWAERLTKQYSTTPLGSDSVLVACTDGVGTKLKVAQIAGRHDTVGIDLVAMSVNDLIVQGAEPLFFLDYFACGKLDRGVASAVVRGIAKGCIDAGCGLIGGETAEMPSMYEEGDYDLAGFAVGAVRRSALLPQKLSAGDVVIGLTSSGVHSNGFSLVRKLVSVHGLDWEAQAPFSTGGSAYSRLCDVILEPTRIYVKALLPLLGAGDAGAAAAGDAASAIGAPAMPNAAATPGKIKALAHITGGGLVENIPRVLADGMTVHLDGTAWKEGCPPVFSWIAGLGSVPVDDLFRTFNCGIGMCVVVAKEDAEDVLADLRKRGEGAYIIGDVREETSPDEDRVTIIGTPF
jgi:phosphoribosylaminoimidazole synthetase